jgi:hypothetical protein
MLLVAALTIVIPMLTSLKVDSCLDAGGSYDYSEARCDLQESHPVVAPKIPASVRLGGGVVLALLGGLVLVFSRRIASEPDMRSNTSLERTRER